MRRGPCPEVVGLQRLLLRELKEKGMYLPVDLGRRGFKLKVTPGVFRLESHQADVSVT